MVDPHEEIQHGQWFQNLDTLMSTSVLSLLHHIHLLFYHYALVNSFYLLQPAHFSGLISCPSPYHLMVSGHTVLFSSPSKEQFV